MTGYVYKAKPAVSARSLYASAPSYKFPAWGTLSTVNHSYPKLTRAYTVRTGLFECPAVLLFAPCTPGTRRSSALLGAETAAV